MPAETIQIKRYPNRRYYARHTSKYVSLQEIEEMVQSGSNVQVTDSQTGEDLTRSVLTQIIMERQPEKIALFPTDMLHCILRSNDAMSEFLRDYFRNSLTYLDFLQRHGATAKTLAQPMHWMKAWLDSVRAKSEPATSPEQDAPLSRRVEHLEERLRQLEDQQPPSESTGSP